MITIAFVSVMNHYHINDSILWHTVFTWSLICDTQYLPDPSTMSKMRHGQFLNKIQQVWNQSFSSSELIALQRLNNPVFFNIYP